MHFRDPAVLFFEFIQLAHFNFGIAHAYIVNRALEERWKG